MAAAASSTSRRSTRYTAGMQQQQQRHHFPYAPLLPEPPHTLSNIQLFYPDPFPPHHCDRHVRASLSSTVDTAKLALWGTSFAGGHVLVVASDPEFKDHIAAVVTQVSECE